MANAEAQSTEKGSNTHKVTLMILGAVVMVALASFTTYFLTSKPATKFGDGIQTSHRNITLTDAQMACEAYARRQLGSRLKNISVDNHSTRYDKRDRRFKIFMEADLYESGNRQGIAKLHYISCFSRVDVLSLSKFELVEDQDYSPKARRKDDTNAFGM